MKIFTRLQVKVVVLKWLPIILRMKRKKLPADEEEKDTDSDGSQSPPGGAKGARISSINGHMKDYPQRHASGKLRKTGNFTTIANSICISSKHVFGEKFAVKIN